MRLVISFLYQPIALQLKKKKKAFKEICTMNAQGQWDAHKRNHYITNSKGFTNIYFLFTPGFREQDHMRFGCDGFGVQAMTYRNV